MARPREFEIDDALSAAMNVFWAKGYEGTSMHDLTEALGIAKGSLYKAFGDKRSLWIRSLEQYDRIEFDQTIAAIDAEPDGARAIAGFLYLPIAALERGDRRGCFFCNASVDQAPHDKQTEQVLLLCTNRLIRSLERALGRLQPKLPRDQVETRAVTLTAGYLGLRVMVKTGAPKEALSAVRDTLLATVAR